MNVGCLDCKWVSDVWKVGGSLGCTLAWEYLFVCVFNPNLLLNLDINFRSSRIWCCSLRGGHPTDDWRVSCQHISPQNHQHIRWIPLVLLHAARGLRCVCKEHNHTLQRCYNSLSFATLYACFRLGTSFLICMYIHPWLDKFSRWYCIITSSGISESAIRKYSKRFKGLL